MSFSKFHDQVIGVMNVYMTRGRFGRLSNECYISALAKAPASNVCA